jgi:hypothetical protein
MIKENYPLALTFDIDWAPDFAIQLCIQLLEKYNIPATFFITHPSPIIDVLCNHPLFEVGIHPNFFPNSSQGNSEKEIMDYLFSIAPSAFSMRTHGLFQSSCLFSFIAENYKQILYDFSLYLPNNPFICPFDFPLSSKHKIIRCPYQFEDDMCFSYSGPASFDFSINHTIFPSANYLILDFHPIHLFLNSIGNCNYTNLKKILGKRSLNSCDYTEAKQFVNTGEGAMTWLMNLFETVDHGRFKLGSAIPRLFTNHQEEIHKKSVICE